MSIQARAPDPVNPLAATRHGVLTHVPVAPLPLERFRGVLTPDQMEVLGRDAERARELLAGRVVWNVSSTARGGGVAEMLISLIAYARGAGADARWVVIEGDESFFRVTKRLHNNLHGAAGDHGPLGPDEREVYERTTARNAGALAQLMREGDVALLHDPQTAGLAGPLRERGVRVIWRCHVGLDLPTSAAREAWRFLLPYVLEAEAQVFSRPAFVWEGLDPSRVSVIPPSIDAFSPKNQDLDEDAVPAILARAAIQSGHGSGDPLFRHQDGTPGRVDRTAEVVGGPFPPDVPVIAQVSRWDRLKDPVGVLESFARWVAPRTGARLVLAGPATAAVTDDPEGLAAFREVVAGREALPAEVRERVHLVSLPMDDAAENAAMVNALQRRADIVVQKSLAEGFGLTVTEAMWKGRPVVASRVGGIQDQVRDGETGVLVDPHDLEHFAEALLRLLEDSERAARLGAAARAEIRDSFLGPRHLTQYVELMAHLLSAPSPDRGDQ
jgi:trehalose synthase